MLELYREALRIRRGEAELASEDLDWLEAPAGVLAYRRGPELIVVVNLSDTAIELPRDRLCLDVLLAHLLRRISAEGAVLDDDDIAVLSRLVVAATEEVLDSMQLCRSLRVVFSTGAVLGPADVMSVSGTQLSSCILASDEMAVSEIVRGLVTGLYRLIDDELVGIYLDALRRLCPAPSQSGWGGGEGS